MAGSFTNYSENLVLTYLMTSGSAARPTAWFVGLFTAAPGETGGGTEVSGTGYVRKAGTFVVAGTDPTTASNNPVIEFDEALAPWGTVTHIGVFDAVTAGNMLGYADLEESKQIGTGDVFRIPVGDLKVTLD
jgi:hypothetical protein